MGKLILNLCSNDKQLAEEIKATSNEAVRVISSVALSGNTEIIVAIIAATPVILKQVAEIIKIYVERNKFQSFSLKINDNEISVVGYSVDEIFKILQKLSGQNVQ